jgi:hypothetical protein
LVASCNTRLGVLADHLQTVSRRLRSTVEQQPASVTVTVAGTAPGIFPLSLILPAIRTSATLPLEQYSVEEQVAR